MRDDEFIQGYVAENASDLLEELSACGVNVLMRLQGNRMIRVG